MAKDGSGFEKRLEAVMPKDASPNGDFPAEYDLIDPVSVGPRWRVSEMQAKVHRWAQAHGRNHGEPVAWRHARRVRRAAWGNGPAAMPAPRPRPTHPNARQPADRAAHPSPQEMASRFAEVSALGHGAVLGELAHRGWLLRLASRRVGFSVPVDLGGRLRGGR